MTKRFMISVAAAALIAGTGFANAQGMGQKEGPAAQQGAPAAEHGAPAAPAGREAAEPKAAPSPGMKATQSEQKAPGAANTQRTEEQGQKSGNMRPENNSAQNKNAPTKDMKAEGRDNNMKTEGRDNNDMKAEGRENREGNKNAETKGGSDRDGKARTTGQAGAGGKLSGEQRTKITSVIREVHVAPVTNVNFSISIGSRVPREVGFHPLPPEVITYYPEWRGYEFILVRDQILVIDPQTYEIVAVLDA